MYWEVILNFFPSKTYVLDHIEFTDLHIQIIKKKKKKSQIEKII